MSLALNSGVSGLNAHQKMLDVAGNNLANVNTTAYKASRVNFSELLNVTIKNAAQPTSSLGGTNPQQIGTGVSVASITPNMTQGNIVGTGNSLDLAIEGQGYFVLSNGQQEVYTRAGAFGVDSDSMLVDPSTGNRVQRIGNVGEEDSFQIAGDSDIHIPYGTAMPARATETVNVSGNLNSDVGVEVSQRQLILSSIAYTYGDGAVASGATTFSQLDQFSGGSLTDGTMDPDSGVDSGQFTISGYNKDGSALSAGLTFDVAAGTTLGDFVDHLNSNVLTDATASIDPNGRIQILDDESGYSRTDILLEYSAVNGSGVLDTPAYFEYEAAGGTSWSTNIEIFDSQGGKHGVSATFIRTEEPNVWDLVLANIQGDIHAVNLDNRRIEGIQFDANSGAFAGLDGSDPSQFVISFGHDPSSPQTINVDMGTVGQFDGLTQFKVASTAIAREQDGYASGALTNVSINNEGVVIGSFSNGVKKNIAMLKMAVFQNPVALEGIGGGFYLPSANSGNAIETQAQAGGAGKIFGYSLEKSNTDVASEFVNMIQAQNGFQANARTIRVANEILNELTNLIR